MQEFFFFLAMVGQTVPEAPTPRLPFDAGRAKSLQLEWAKAFGASVAITNSLGMKLALIPGGRFDMGANGSKYRVQLAMPYYLGTTEVPMSAYKKFKPTHAVDGKNSYFNPDDLPAAQVSWNDARAFCNWLSERPEEKAANRVYSLPTEAQWEWAARAGTSTSRYFGDGNAGQAEYSWFNVSYTPNPKQEAGNRGRQPVGRLKPNAWGLYDMLGNVWEWCGDRRVDEATGETRDPVMRGGSWRSGAFHCTAVAQDPGDPDQRADHVGFRISCRVIKKK